MRLEEGRYTTCYWAGAPFNVAASNTLVTHPHKKASPLAPALTPNLLYSTVLMPFKMEPKCLHFMVRYTTVRATHNTFYGIGEGCPGFHTGEEAHEDVTHAVCR